MNADVSQVGAYLPQRVSRSEWLDLRGTRLHIRRWGREAAPKLFMVHGWMDVAASFQFLVDALSGDWDVIAPDLRGFGESAWSPDGYLFSHYLADLDCLLERYSPTEPVRLLGHSLGGNVVCLYAGVRPARVAAVVALDTWGLRDAAPEEAPQRLEKWLAQWREPERFRSYTGFDVLAQRLRHENPRLSAPRAAFLARHLGEDDGLGGVIRAADPLHKHVSPTLYRFAEMAAVWRRIDAPVLHLLAEDERLREHLQLSREEVQRRLALFAHGEVLKIAEAGHNLQHDQPEQVAAALEAFLQRHGLQGAGAEAATLAP